MPLSFDAKTAIETMLAAENEKLNIIVEGREDCYALMRFDSYIPDADCLAIIAAAKLKAKTAAQELVTLLS